MKLARFIAPLVLCALLTACETSMEAPDTASAVTTSKSNFRTRGGPSSPSYASDNKSTPGPRHLEEDEADQAVLDSAERMVKQGDFVSATVLYKRAVNANPTSISSIKGLAKLYEAQDKPREALDSWRAVVALDEYDPEAHRGMGRDLMALGLYPKAIEALKRAHELRGEDDLKTVNLLAMAELRNNQSDEAIATLEEVVKYSDDLATKNNLGFIYVMSNKVDKAIPILEEVAKDPKATAQQRQNLALAYGLAGRDEDARAISLQDLPPAAVANNIKTYHAMRDKMNGKATPVIEDAKPVIKKRKPKVIKVEPVPTPAAAPTTPVTSVPAPAATPPGPAAAPAATTPAPAAPVAPATVPATPAAPTTSQ